MVGIPPAPCCAPQIEVAFGFDANSVLSVSAVDELVKKQGDIIITIETGHLPKEEMEQMLAYAKTFEQVDGMQRSRIEAKASS
ncbi:unnamed protein product [Taenia asiatica]|uniref:Alcohol dehydrogenase n=1 Tax=Taenia asiatica TaxID=60517 RepID=A0A0R3WCN7_TAEAS|nr:unnamed protein product [Taenia asiatica]